MRPALFRLALLLFTAVAMGPVHAQIYKWVDAKGTTHYSDKPPADRKQKTQVVEDRLSVIPSDPAIPPATEAMRAQGARAAELAQAEWLQRQRLMLAAQSTPSYECPYRVNCDSPYGYGYYGYGYGGYGYLLPPRVVRGPQPPRPPHLRPPHPRPPRPMPVRANRL
jgi:hypothetical protein